MRLPFPICLVLLSACASPPLPLNALAPPPEPVLMALAQDLEPLRQAFNEHADKPRLISFQSPTCSHCDEGALALRDGILEAFEGEDLRVLVIWLDILPEDGRDPAYLATGEFADERVIGFHDPERKSCTPLARGVLPVAIPRHTYLLYAPGQRWVEEPPKPRFWAHQLGRLAPEFYRSPEGLAHQLRVSMEAILEDQAPRSLAGQARHSSN